VFQTQIQTKHVKMGTICLKLCLKHPSRVALFTDNMQTYMQTTCRQHADKSACLLVVCMHQPNQRHSASRQHPPGAITSGLLNLGRLGLRPTSTAFVDLFHDGLQHRAVLGLEHHRAVPLHGLQGITYVKLSSRYIYYVRSVRDADRVQTEFQTGCRQIFLQTACLQKNVCKKKKGHVCTCPQLFADKVGVECRPDADRFFLVADSMQTACRQHADKMQTFWLGSLRAGPA